MSSAYLNSTLEDVVDSFDKQSPVECYKLKIIALYCIITMIFGIIFNSALLWILIYFKDLRNSVNSFMIALSAFNLFGCVFEFPFVIISNLSCKWNFKKAGCVFSGFVMYFIGCTSIYLMAAISFERFYIIYKPMSIKTLNFKYTALAIGACVLVGGFWSSVPLFGWSYYSLEGARTSCSVEWNERTYNVMSYNITIFAVVYIIPLICILCSNVKLVQLIKNMPKLNTGNQRNQVAKRMVLEKELTVTTIILVVGFIISWTPYALVSMYAAFIDNTVSPLTGTIPSMFAKSSMVWSAVIYIFTNKQIKYKFGKMFDSGKEAESVSMNQSDTMRSDASAQNAPTSQTIQTTPSVQQTAPTTTNT